ncbi:MAG: tryptophan-rich hypothetical protein [Arenicella sp.]|jgi:tryptophan-rich hypothetical protein
MNKINPKKLLHSKWTSTDPRNKEKHFIVMEVEYDELEKEVVACQIEAVISKRSMPIQWQELKDTTKWLHGWQ